MRRNGLLTLLMTAGLFGCTMIPHYTRPAPPVPAQWPAGPAYKDIGEAHGGEVPPMIGWREFYTDERLQKIIELALGNNRDLRIAVSNIEKARALYRIQAAQLFPMVDGLAAASRQRVPIDTSLIGRAYTETEYTLGAGITSWEIDFFGRIRSLKESVLQQYLATEQAQADVRISLMAEVANAYFTLAADNEGFKLARSTLEARLATYDMVRRRLEVGASSGLDLSQAQTVLESARGDVARYTSQVALDENALNLLAGIPVPVELLADSLGSIAPPTDISPGLSSQMLLHRPDVIQTENLLKAANANIGAARAAFFPSISLSTNIGTVSMDLSRLFRAGSSTWLFAPQIDVPIFDAGTRQANLEAVKADRTMRVAEYEKAIQSAFKETADALAQRGTLGDQIRAQESLVAAASDAYSLSDARYEKGIDSYLNVLDAQRSLYAAQQGLISLNLVRLGNMVTLYKVLGGG